MVLHGEWRGLYHEGPDRYLYAPGLAWIFAPLALLNSADLLGAWSGLKLLLLLLASFLWLERRLPQATTEKVGLGVGLILFAFLMVYRPLLIDFHYGQINSLILPVSALAFLFLDRTYATPTTSSAQGFRSFPLVAMSFSFFWLGILTVAKILTLPLLGVPAILFFHPGTARRLKTLSLLAGVSATFGALLVLLAPLATLSWSDTLWITEEWLGGLSRKGLPLESHNQSILSIVSHLFSGEPTFVKALYRNLTTSLPGVRLPSGVFEWLKYIVFLVVGFLSAHLLLRTRNSSTSSGSVIGVPLALLMGTSFLASYLVWKTYFVFGFFVALEIGISFAKDSKRMKTFAPLLFGIFALMNLTSLDIIGPVATGYAESYGALLFSHVGLLLILHRLEQNEAFLPPTQAKGF
jgi:hypothetical protein